MSAERRRLPRVSGPLAGHIRGCGTVPSPWRDTTVVNLSPGGVRARGPDSLEVGSLLDVRILLPEPQPPLLIRGRVIWSQLQGAGVIESGVQFLEPTPRQCTQIAALMGPGTPPRIHG